MPIKIDSRFATARDTAKMLGVSAHRTEKLVALVERALRRAEEDDLDGKAAVRYRSKRKASRSVSRNDATFRAKTSKAKR